MAKRPLATPARELTPRQITFAKHLVTGATITEAARRAGYSEKNLAQSGHQVLKAVQLKMPELMVDAGLTAEVLIYKYLLPLLSATTKKCFHHNGKIIYSRAFPDYRTRVMALDMAFRLIGAYATGEPVSAANQGVKVIVMDGPRPLRPVVTNVQTPILPPPMPSKG